MTEWRAVWISDQGALFQLGMGAVWLDMEGVSVNCILIECGLSLH